MTAVPDTAAALAYVNNAYPEAQVASALAAETALQAAACRVAVYNDALAEALLRRVARNLAMRQLPLGVQASELGGTYIGSTDPEVRRLEGPFRRLVVG